MTQLWSSCSTEPARQSKANKSKHIFDGRGRRADKIDGPRRPTPQHQRKEEKQSRMDVNHIDDWVEEVEWVVGTNKALFRVVGRELLENIDNVFPRGAKTNLELFIFDAWGFIKSEGIAMVFGDAGNEDAHNAIRDALAGQMMRETAATLTAFMKLIRQALDMKVEEDIV